MTEEVKGERGVRLEKGGESEELAKERNLAE